MVASSDINTNRLLITSFTERHLSSRYVGWLNDPDVIQFSEQRHKSHNVESCRLYWQSFHNTPNYFWAIEEVKYGYGHIGNINAYVNKIHNIADVGIMIGDKRLWRNNYGLEAWIAVFKFLFRQLNLRKITAGAISVNFAMLNMMKKAGMVPDGIRGKQFIFNDQEVDIVHYAIFKEQWDSIAFKNNHLLDIKR
jgi:RimJ/RimL family protein N-acetyltransferase